MTHFSLYLAAAAGILLSLAPPAAAQQPPQLCKEDLKSLSGICVTQVPDRGRFLLGSREIRPGDILTRAQASALEFESLGENCLPTLECLAISPEGSRETALFSLGKKKNLPPEVRDSREETYKNLELRGTLKASDPEQEPMTFTVLREPRRGSLTVETDGSFLYTPKKNKVGTDSFQYTASDSAGNTSEPATVILEIRRPSDMPQYVDTAGKDCSYAAEWMKHSGLFVGEVLDGKFCFQPEKPVTQGEFLTVLLKALHTPVEEDFEHCQAIDDAPAWLRPYVAAALRSGMAAAMPRPFTPDTPMTEGQAAAMLQIGLDLPVPAAAFRTPALDALEEAGFSLTEDSILTRARAAALLCSLTHQAE